MPSGGQGAAAMGLRFTLLAMHGRVFAWGHDASGELGDGSTTARPLPVAVTAVPAGAVAVAAGKSHGLALMADGTVFGWGHNRSGELGDGTKIDRLLPVRIKGLHDVRGLAAGDGFSLALEADGTVLAWGNNKSGQLGDGNAPMDHAAAAVVHGLGPSSGVVEIAAGSSFGMVRKADGSVWEWGNGTSGQLGDGKNDKQSAPTVVKGLGPGSHVIAVAGGGAFSLALKSDGTVLAWGHNRSGQLGDSHPGIDRAVPAAVVGLGAGSGVVGIAAGDSFSLALKKDGTVLAWGHNKSGELGDGSAPTDHATPVRVAGFGPGSGVRAVAAGGFHALAITASGIVWAWGNNSSGELGDGTAPTDHHTPVRVRLPKAAS